MAVDPSTPATRCVVRLLALFALALGAAAAPAAPTNSAAELLSLRQFGAETGLPQMTVLAIAQDGDGFVYVGTQDGLARYDGRRFERVTLAAGVHDIVSELLLDGSGRLWIGTSESGLFRRERDGRVRSLALPAPVRAIEAFAAVAGSDEVWVGAPEGLFRCGADACQAIPVTAGIPIAALLVDADERAPGLWLGSNDRGVLRLDLPVQGEPRLSAKTWSHEQGLPNRVVRSLAWFGKSPRSGRRYLWVGTGRGVARIDGDEVVAFAPAQGFPVGGALALQVVRDHDGREALWAASYGGGLIRFRDTENFSIYGLNQGLPESFLYSLYDSQSDARLPSRLWIGTGSAGLLRLEPGRWSTLDERHVLPSKSVVSAGELRSRDGGFQLWAGTLAGAVVQASDGSWDYLLPAPWRDVVVYSALRAPDGTLWAGTLGGLLQVNDGVVREYTAEANRLPGVSVTQLLWRGGVDGELWIGTGHGLARWRQGRVALLFPEHEILAGTSIRGLLPVSSAPDAEIAIASSDGLLLTDGERVRRAPADCLPHPEIIDLARARDGVLWAATRRGVARIEIRGEQIDCRTLRYRQGEARTTYALALDRAGRLYAFGYDGAQRIDNPEAVLADDGELKVLHYGIEDGLPSLEFNRDALCDQQGRIWAANNAGLAVFDPQQPPLASPPATLWLRGRVGAAPLSTGMRLPAEHGVVRFEFRLLSFDAEHRIRYRSRLDGLATPASEWTRSSSRQFDRLPPGDYRFELEALDSQGQVVRADAIEFAVAYPWWLHPATLALAVLGLILTGLQIGRHRVRLSERRARELEQEVANRTAALEAANRQLSQASTTDALTGARNRRHFYAEVANWATASADSGGLWLLLVDIDHFKRINDEHGHDAGDAVLVETAARLRAALADGGELLRWGGEEFLLVLHHAARVDIGAQLPRLLRAVAEPAMAHGGSELTVTVSIGATRLRPPAQEVAAQIDGILKRADQALYGAKRHGRDRAVVAEAGNEALREYPRQPGGGAPA